MKIRLANLCWEIVWILVVFGVICAVLLSRPDKNAQKAAQKAVEATRLALRQQGFKTDLADFDFSTSAELRAREAILRNAVANRNPNPFVDHPNLMEAVGTNSAIVVWKQNSLKRQYSSGPGNNNELNWDEFRDAINEHQPELDAACNAALSGPIRFNLNASGGNGILLPHLAMLKNLTQTFDSRAMLALHDGNRDAAWTNLLASTRLVTVWEPEPVEISHLVRFGDMKLVFNATWQALQADGWPDEQLARLQSEWESVDFFTNLPETVAFKRASDVAVCQRGGQEHLEPSPTLTDFLKEALRSPFFIWSELNHRWDRANYLRHGSYEDETNLFLFYRDRELELRNAVQASTWSQMRQLPGVTKALPFQSKYHSRMQAMLNVHAISMRFQREGSSILGRAAEAEARRRILIAAIALERYRGKHGSYPNTLTELAPEFLKNPPVDFMDGQPLRYRLTEDGHFVLYSVGLDCVDNGGQMPSPERQRIPDFKSRGFGAPPKGDLVWPLPAAAAKVEALRRKETRARELQNLREQEEESEREWNQSPLRQARVGKILATKWSPDAGNMSYQGRPANEDIHNGNVTGTNWLSLTELLTPKQIITGDEPENVTFEVPVSYDVITNRGGLTLLVDADPDDPATSDSGAKMQDCNRATNGDCLLVWHSIYDPPGQHAVQVQLFWMNEKRGEFIGKGPAISVVTSNLCQFSLASAHFDPETGATFRARLPEKNGQYTVELNTTNGTRLKTITGSTTNGVIKVHWDLMDDHGVRFTNDFFNSVFHSTLPDSGRSQTLKGP